jgi:hypothetical protein
MKNAPADPGARERMDRAERVCDVPYRGRARRLELGDAPPDPFDLLIRRRLGPEADEPIDPIDEPSPPCHPPPVRAQLDVDVRVHESRENDAANALDHETGVPREDLSRRAYGRDAPVARDHDRSIPNGRAVTDDDRVGVNGAKLVHAGSPSQS